MVGKLTCPVCGYGLAMRVTSCPHCRKKAKKLSDAARRERESA